MLVVNDLGVECLIGEPGKSRNNLICLPRQKLIILADGDIVHYTPYYEEKQCYTLARAATNSILQPGDHLSFSLPEEFSAVSHIAITPRSETKSWLMPAIVKPSEGKIFLTNSSEYPVKVGKAMHIAD